jgi:glycosyltransferase involved in cell wall biosynthesis
VFFWGVADTLGKMGHEIHLFAPGGSKIPTNGQLHYILGTEKGQIDYGKEVWLEKEYHGLLMDCDLVWSCSLDHIDSERLRFIYGKKEIVNTINGRCYRMPRPPFNVVTGSRAWQQDALAHGLQTEMCYWGIDTEFYTPGDRKYSERGNWYLWISRFHPDKGLDMALDMAEWLGIELKVAGSMSFSDHAEHGKKYLERIKGIKNVEYIELPMDKTHHEVKRELYRNAKAFLYPVQYFECFGMVVVEAMACGCPVLATPSGAMPELVESGRSGFICHTKEDFVHAIQKLIPTYNDSSGIHKGFNIWETCREQALKFSWENSAKTYEQLFMQVLEGKEW